MGWSARGLLLGAWVLAAFCLVPQAQAELVINEILGDPLQDWDGDGILSFRGDEWIEVLNNGASEEDLTEYWLRDDHGEDPHLNLFGTLEPGQVAIFYGSDSVAWQLEQGQSGYGFSINNTGDTIELLRSVPEQSPDTLIMIHRVILNSHEVEDDRSSGWDLSGEEWTLFDALNPYSGTSTPEGNDCLPTPGQLNVCEPLVPVHPTRWDHLKSRYR